MFTQQVTSGFFEAPSLWISAFMAIAKCHWLPIHSLMLMFALKCHRPIFSVLPSLCWPYNRCEKHSVFTPEPVYVRQCFTFYWKMLCVFYCICKYILNTDQISNTCLLWFSIQIKIHKISVYKYIFEPNPGLKRHVTYSSDLFVIVSLKLWQSVVSKVTDDTETVFICVVSKFTVRGFGVYLFK